MFGKNLLSSRLKKFLNLGRTYMKKTNLRYVFAMVVVLVTAMMIMMPGLSTDRVNASRVVGTSGHLSGSLPVFFEENRGQRDSRVKYFSRGAGMDMFLTETEAVYVVRSQRIPNTESRPDHVKRASHEARPSIQDSKAVAVYMQLAGANAGASFVPSEKLGHETNYFMGNEADWRTGIPNFGSVKAESIYNGIDLVWKGKEQGGIQYDFVLAANADPNQIEWEIEGADNVSLDADGGLVIETEAGVMKQSKPFTFQETDGARFEVSSQWSVTRNMVKGGGQKFSAKYTLGEYDRSKPLTIDPLAYSTFLGGSSFDSGEKIVVDAAGNAYLTGLTFSTAFPTTPGVFDTTNNGSGDAFVAKLNAAGSALVYSTFIGGNSSDYGHGIAVDTSGNVFVTGDTNSPTFPTTAGAFDTTHNGAVDGFVAKLDPAGSALLYSTFIGGAADDYGYSIAADSAGNAFVTGSSGSTTFPTTAGAFDTTHNGGFDAFVTKLNAAGSSLVYSTFIGGTASDDAYGLAVDASGNAFVTGETDSTTYPTTAGAFDTTYNGVVDAFVTKLNPSGSSLLYSTFIGGNSDDGGYGIAADSTGNAFVTGYTSGGSTAFPTTAGAFDTTHNGSSDAFVTKVNAAGSSLVYSTFIGGSSTEDGRAIAVDTSGNALLTGGTNSPTFPTTVGAFDTTHNGDFDAFVTKLNAAGSLLVDSTFIGGSSLDVALGLAVDSSGNAFVTGETGSTGFPTTVGALDTTQNGGEDAFVIKIELPAGFESDVAPRPNGDGALLSTDITQVRRFVAGLDTPSVNPNEFQRTDSAPRSSFGDGVINSSDVVQVRRYGAGLDPLTIAGGPTAAADPPLRAVIDGSLFGAKVAESSELRLSSGKGGVVSVDLNPTCEVAAVSFRVRYDAALGKPLVSLDEVTDGAVLTVNDSVEGELIILIDSAGPLGDVGKVLRLVEISFAGGSADGMVELDGAASVSDMFGNDVRVALRRGRAESVEVN